MEIEGTQTMKMLLRNIPMLELKAIFERHRNRSSASWLKDAGVIRKARRLARKNGIWKDLKDNLDPSRDIPVLKRSAYRQHRRTGNRTVSQNASFRRSGELNRAAMAFWLNHPKADLDYLQDLLWAFCDDFTWVMAAHENRAIDLGSSALAATFAEILEMVGDRLEKEVVERVSSEIQRRIFEKFWSLSHLDTWQTLHHNWNLVCNGNIIRTALYQIDDPETLAHAVHAPIQNMTYALDGFAEDGGCREGLSYWVYGFGHFLKTAFALYQKTDGKLNILRDEKIERVCRYPLASHISGIFHAPFGDAAPVYVPAFIALLANRFYRIPELYETCAVHPDGTLKLVDWHELALYGGEKASGRPNPKDYWLPDLGMVKLRGAPGEKQLTLLALAGNNGVPHNHNDIGSFIVHRAGRNLLDDPGAPLYSGKTFSPRRYEIVYCNSLGHSVPLLNNTPQAAGEEYFGTLEVLNLNGEGEKTALLDMTPAYPVKTLESLRRSLTLEARENRILLEDDFRFTRKPRALEEAFITFQKVSVAEDARSVRIGPKSSGLLLSSRDTPGKFHARKVKEALPDSKDGALFTRITFVPQSLSTRMSLKFSIK